VPSFQGHLLTLERWRAMPALERVDEAGGAAALTFDDGPDPDATPAVLEALEEAGVRATFFMVGEQVMANIELARAVPAGGHEVALHGFEHRPHEELTPQQARDDLARGLGAVEAATGARPRLYRPPYGLFSEASYEACRELELEPVYWSAWGLDHEPLPAERIADLVCRDLVPGLIVVLHDSPRYAYRESARPTAEAIPEIASEARRRGVGLAPLGELVG
jgi:peptidoglycan-N-acetylglucosamine deacetylase